MGAWGTGPLTNDAAQDLHAALEPLRGGERVLAVMTVFAEYTDWDRRRREAGTTADWPEADDGSEEVMRTIAAAWLVAAALERVERPANPSLLDGEPAGVLLELAKAAQRMLAMVLADDTLAANWHQNADAWTAEVRRLHAALAPDAPEVPAGTGRYEDLDDPATLALHNRQYKTKLILLLAAIAVAVTVLR